MESILNFLKEEPHLKSLLPLLKANRSRAYLVGGFLRNLLLNKKDGNLDLDFAVSRDALKLAKSFSRKIKGFYVLLDKKERCARVIHNVNGKAYTLDFAQFRGPTIKADLAKRDFTVNALGVEVGKIFKAAALEEILMDECGGLKDLRRGLLRMVSKTSFKDDPLRIVRAFSLSATLGFTIDESALQQAKKDSAHLVDVAGERMRDELFKILNVQDSVKYLRMMDERGVLEEIIPQISLMRNVAQGPYHHLDVLQHSFEAVFQLEQIFKETQNNPDIVNYLKQDLVINRSRKALMKLGALLHDIGKPQSKRLQEERTLFHGHERAGKDIADGICEMLKLSNQEKSALEKMILWHLRPGYLADNELPTPRAVFRYFRDTGQEGISTLLISLADQRATCGPLTSDKDRLQHERVNMDLIAQYFQKQKEKKLPPLITGNDLIKKLKLKPSPVFGKILREIEESRAEGTVKTKDEALKLAKKLAAGH